MQQFSMTSGDVTDPCVTRILVLGGTGHGKSSFINAMMGKDKCAVGVTWAVDKSITTDVQEFQFTRKDDSFVFVDTPALKGLPKNKKFAALYKTGFHAVVVIYSIKAFTQPRPSLLQQVESALALTDKMGDYTLVALTFADYLEDATVEEFVNTNKELKDFLQKCKANYVVICNSVEKNSPKGTEQRDSFFRSLDEIRRRNVKPLSKKSCIVGIKCVTGIVVTSLVIIGIGILLYFYV